LRDDRVGVEAERAAPGDGPRQVVVIAARDGAADVVRHEELRRAVVAVHQVLSSRCPVDGVLAGLSAVVEVQQVPVRFGLAAAGACGRLP
jgi:hypothetical protein